MAVFRYPFNLRSAGQPSPQERNDVTIVYSDECAASVDVTSSILSQHVSAHMYHLQGIMRQIICKNFYKTSTANWFNTRTGFVDNFTYNLVHDPLKMTHMCRNMLR
jgi:hypothetical protein